MSILRSLFGKNAEASPEVIEDEPEIEPASPQERRCRERNNARPGTRVLIIDDSPTVVAALGRILESVQYHTFEAGDAESGIEVARNQLPELIFLDLVLPGMNGFAALRQMRRDPLLKNIPVIMISGNEQATEQFYANRIGADDFMKKPFSRSEVFAKIEPLLDDDQIPRRKGLPQEDTTPAVTIAQPPAAPQTAPAAAVAAPVVAAPALNPATVPVPPAPAVATAPAAPAAPPVQAVAQAPAIVVAATPVVALAPAAQAPLAPAPAVAAPVSAIDFGALEARKELTAMGLQYFDQNHFLAAIKRGDRLAFELFIAGGGVDLNAETDGKTPLQVAREHGRTQIFALLRARLNATAA